LLLLAVVAVVDKPMKVAVVVLVVFFTLHLNQFQQINQSQLVAVVLVVPQLAVQMVQTQLLDL
jgi:hypothetical protein